MLPELLARVQKHPMCPGPAGLIPMPRGSRGPPALQAPVLGAVPSHTGSVALTTPTAPAASAPIQTSGSKAGSSPPQCLGTERGSNGNEMAQLRGQRILIPPAAGQWC